MIISKIYFFIFRIIGFKRKSFMQRFFMSKNTTEILARQTTPVVDTRPREIQGLLQGNYIL